MNQQQTSIFDGPQFGTAPIKITRRDAPDTSRAAGHQVDTTRWEQLCLEHCLHAGVRGVTNAETVAHYRRPVHTISGRWSALIDKGLVFDSGLRRDRGRVIGASKYRDQFLREQAEALALSKTRESGYGIGAA